MAVSDNDTNPTNLNSRNSGSGSNWSWNIFGFQISRAKEQQEIKDNKTFVVPQNDDGAVTIQSGSYFGTYVDMDGAVRNEVELITKYRDMSIQPEVESCIDDIVNEAIVTDGRGKSVSLYMEDLEQKEKIKKLIQDEFHILLKMLNFNNMGHEIFRRWYIDGRLFYHVIVDEKKMNEGIQELRLIDPRRIRKVREIKKGRDPKTGLEIIEKETEYYVYNERGIVGSYAMQGARIAKDSIVYTTSGLMDSKRAMVLSYLHKAIKPLNQLRMLEDATVIYRLSRAPERRVFYVDVGNMPTQKAEQYIRSVMTNYRNKLVYDSNTGEIKDDRKFMSMLEDFWIPRREGNKSSEISTLPGGQNLGQIEDVEYFEKKLYKALGVPYTRTQPNQGFSLGRSTDVTRDELKFSKFIDRLRNKFSTLFDDLLRVQLVLKKVCTEEEWDKFKEDIYYDFLKDNNFDELKEAELNTARIQLVSMADPFVGKYYSKEWVQKEILRFNDEQMEELEKQMKEEMKDMLPTDPETGEPMPGPVDAQMQQDQQQGAGGPPGLPPPQPMQPFNKSSSQTGDKPKNKFNAQLQKAG
jgi:polyhydroxyalkanoate synthesis regulator phasin